MVSFAMLGQGWELVQELWREPAFLHHWLMGFLVWAPVLGLVVFVAESLRGSEGGMGRRPGLILLMAVLPMLFAYEASVQAFVPEIVSQDLLSRRVDPSRGLYQLRMQEHLQELRMLYVPAMVLAAVALLHLLLSRRGLFFTLALVLAVAVFWLLAMGLYERKLRYDHGELPAGGAALHEFWLGAQEDELGLPEGEQGSDLGEPR